MYNVIENTLQNCGKKLYIDSSYRGIIILTITGDSRPIGYYFVGHYETNDGLFVYKSYNNEIIDIKATEVFVYYRGIKTY